MDESSIHDQILAFLRTHQKASIPELSVALHVTRQDVRYNLTLLLSEGVVTKVTAGSRRPKLERGRPSQFYSLNPKSRPDNLLALVRALLLLQIDSSTEEGEGESIQRLASGLIRLAGPAPKSLHVRLNQAVQILNHSQYQSHWEARPTGPCILFANCPYAAILEEFPVLCQVDGEILTQLTGKKVHQTEKIDLAGQSPYHCLFKIV